MSEMNQQVIARWHKYKDQIEAALVEGDPTSWTELFDLAAPFLIRDFDPDRRVAIDHGDYQGSLLFVSTTAQYQPSTYWCTLISYGSCSACDQFQAIEWERGEQRTKELMTLVLHIAQKTTEVGSW